MNKLKEKKRSDSDNEEDQKEFELQKMINQKQVEIEDLKKKMRYMEHDYKKKEIEINGLLQNERQRVEELQDIINKKLANIKENKEIDELQNKLSIVEDELFEKQQIAHEMLRQLADMEQENDCLKNELERIKIQSPSLKSIKPNADIDVEKIVNKCMELQKENNELLMEVEQIKRGAIDTIVEKEKNIIDLQEQLELLAIEMKQMDENILHDNEYAHREELQSMQNQYEQRIQLYEEKIQEAMQRLEQVQLSHEEELLNLEKEITERVFENTQQHIDSAKNIETNLMHQVQFYEDKSKNQEKIIQDSQKLLTNTREDFKKEKDQFEQKIRNLTKQAEQVEETNRISKQITKEFEDYRKQSEKEITEKQSHIEKLISKRDEMMKIQVNLDSENKRLKENLDNQKQSIKQLEEQTEQLQDQLEETQNDIHFRIKELTDKFEKEKFILLEEYKSQISGDRVRKPSLGQKNYSYSNEFIKQNSPYLAAKRISQAQQNSDKYDFPKLSLDKPDEIKETSDKKEEFNQKTAPQVSFFSPSIKPEQNNSQDKSQRPKSTLLGLEFGDEDFNIEEEEKIDKLEKETTDTNVSNVTTDGKETQSENDSQYIPESNQSIQELPEYKTQSQINSDNRKKKISFNIVESKVNPLLGSNNNNKNQFKKQFMLPQQQQQFKSNEFNQKSFNSMNNLNSQSNFNTFNNDKNFSNNVLTFDQVARGYNFDNIHIQEVVNENIDLKLYISKLEFSMNGYEFTIEKLQNESKKTLKQLQEYRKQKVLTNNEADLIDELNALKSHCHRIETQFVTQKLQLTEELHFYKEEARIFEKLSNENRDQLIQVSQDKEYYQQKYTKLRNILKQRRAEAQLRDAGSYFPENYEVPQENKRSFWLFK